ncbi:MAG: amino acid adenylation domain-containing protein [Blastocatellia bacterium]|nr:amino acid adenylation domain-containing protein [Blastocatellia bacterium]
MAEGFSAAPIRFESEVSVAQIADLTVGLTAGHGVFPVAAALEMAVAAGFETLGQNGLFLSDLTFGCVPALPPPETTLFLTAIIQAETSETQRFEITLRETSGFVAQVVTGRFKALPEGVDAPDLSCLRGRCCCAPTPPQAVVLRETLELVADPHVPMLTSFRLGIGEALAELALPVQSESEPTPFWIHPLLLDFCLKLAVMELPALPQPGEKVWIPGSIRHIKVFRRLQAPVKAFLKWDKTNPDAVVVDLLLFDDAESPAVEIKGLQFAAQPMVSLQDTVADWLYEMVWQPQPTAWDGNPQFSALSPQSSVLSPDSWLILSEPHPFCDLLQAELQRQGIPFKVFWSAANNQTVTSNEYLVNLQSVESVAATLAQLPGKCSTIVSLLGMSPPDGKDPQAQAVAVSYATAVLFQSFLTQSGASRPRLWVVTEDSQKVTATDEVRNLAGATLWGLIRVAIVEIPGSVGGLVDVEPAAQLPAVRQVVNEILHPDGERLLAFREGTRFVSRLCRTRPTRIHPQTKFQADATYLVTGGFGGIGQTVIHWLAANGARNVAVLSRNPGETALELANSLPVGTNVRPFAVDVADVDALTQTLTLIQAEMPPVKGIFHAAGVLDDGSLIRLSRESLERVFRPKLGGAWNLHWASQNLPLDFFVLFASVTPVFGTPGQANYAAANAALDALAAFRRQQGQPAICLDFGPWAEVGMAAQTRSRRSLDQVVPFSPAEGIAVLDRVLSAKAQAATVAVKVDWNQVAASFGQHPLANFFSELVLPQHLAGSEAPVPKASSEGDPIRLEAERCLLDLAALTASGHPARLRQWLQMLVGRTLEFASGTAPDCDTPLQTLGFDSLLAVELKETLSEAFNFPFSATLVFDYPTINALAGFLSEHIAAHPPKVAVSGTQAPQPCLEKAGSLPTELRSVSQESDAENLVFKTNTTTFETAIAIVGIGCRFPGGVNSAKDFWEFLRNGTDAISEIPAERWDVDALFDPEPGKPGKIYTKCGGFLSEIDRFDPYFFRISPREAVVMDPQHRLLLETAWEALENAGIAPADLSGSPTGVFVGISGNDYLFYGRDFLELDQVDVHSATAGDLCIAANRLSYFFNFLGPSFAVDTACSSSLVAVHQACQSLKTGESTLALAAGVNIILIPDVSIAFSQTKSLAPDGRCKSFSANANGYVRSEGCGVVVLKRLDDALRDCNPIYGVIQGSAINQNGRSNGMTTPNGQAQLACIRQAMAEAKVLPSEIGYVEGHGTGTILGDSIELNALGMVFSEITPTPWVGSVKSNLGHLESASGVASLIKTVLLLQKGEIVPSLHFDLLNPHVSQEASRLRVPVQVESWPQSLHRKVAGVSSFGWGGTNVHLVVEALDGFAPTLGKAPPPPYLWVLSAQSQGALKQLANLHLANLADFSELDLYHACATLARGRSHFAYRLAIVCQSRVDISTGLQAFLQNQKHPVVFTGKTGTGLSTLPQNSLTNLAEDYVLGRDCDWTRLYPDGSFRLLSLPTYPFERERYWLEPPAGSALPGTNWEMVRQVVLKTDEERLPVSTTADVVLLDAEGRELAHLPQLQVDYRQRPALSGQEPWFYQIAWEAQPRPKTTGVQSKPGQWLVLTGSTKIGKAVAALLEAGGETCLTVKPGNAFEVVDETTLRVNPRLPDDFAKIPAYLDQNLPLRGIVFLWPLDEVAGGSVHVSETVLPWCLTLASLTRIFGQTRIQSEAPRLWVVTRGAQTCREESEASLAGAAVWGMGRSIAWEHPSLWGGLIDLDPAKPMGEAAFVVEEIWSPTAETQIAWRTGERLVARLAEQFPDHGYQPPTQSLISPDGTYLITGGTGGLGLAVTDWLIKQGATQVVLVGRKVQSELASRFAQTSATVRFEAADVSDRNQLAKVFERINQELPPLKGVFHLAGVSAPEAVIAVTEENTEAVFAGKVEGAIWLDELTQELNLDHFVLFGSVAAVWGSSQLAAYAAANEILNQLAARRRHQGKPGMCIHFGPWAEVGMAAAHSSQAEGIGLVPLTPRQTLEGLGFLLSANPVQSILARFDWPMFESIVTSSLETQFFSNLGKPKETISLVAAKLSKVKENPAEEANFREQLLNAPIVERERLLVSYLQASLGRSLNIPVEKISSTRNLTEFGLDSILATDLVMEFKEKLKLPVYLAEILGQPSLEALAGYLAKELVRGDLRSKCSGDTHAEPLKIETRTETVPANSGLRSIALGTPKSSFSITPSEKKPKRALFVLSSPRSGSTLFRVMLAGHPELFSPPELHLLSYNTMGERCQALGVTGMGSGLQRSFMELLELSIEEGRNFIEDLTRRDLPVRDVYQALCDLAVPRLLVDKTPMNAASMEGLLHAEALFEAPLYVHLIRHPYSVVESYVRNRFDKIFGGAEGDPARIGEQVWEVSNSNITKFFQSISPNRGLVVRYEDLVANPEREMRRVCEFLSIPFHAALLQPYEGDRMTQGLHIKSKGIGDPNFHNHQTIEAELGEVWRSIQLPHNLKAATAVLARSFGYELPHEAKEEAPNHQLEKLKPAVSEAPQTPENTDSDPLTYPLSFAQQRIWLIEHLRVAESQEFMPAAVPLVLHLSGPLNLSALQCSLNTLVQRHAILRTTFTLEAGNPVQRIGSVDEIPLPVFVPEKTGLNVAEIKPLVDRFLRQPFHLEQGPLFRAGLFQLAETDHILALGFHHIITDGWSTGIVNRELTELYNSCSAGHRPNLPPLTLQYADYAQEQQSRLCGAGLEHQLSYWKQKLDDGPRRTSLPTDFPRSKIQIFRGTRERIHLPAKIAYRLREVARNNQATLFMTLLAAFKTLLARYTEQSDLCVGTVITNRDRVELKPLIGFFMNTLALRTRIPVSGTFQEVLAAVRETALGAYAHQEIPFEKVLETVGSERDLSQSPLFQTMLVLQNFPKQAPEFAGLQTERIHLQNRSTKCDLTLWVNNAPDGGLNCKFEYDTELFEPATIRRMSRHFANLVAAIVANPQTPIDRLSLMDEAEQEELASWSIGPELVSEPGSTVLARFVNHVQTHPEACAVVSDGKQVTYRELFGRAAAIAEALRAQGMQPGDMVGILLERSIEAVAALLGIWLAEGAFVPLDPDHPAAKLAAVFEVVKPVAVVTFSQYEKCLPPTMRQVWLDQLNPLSSTSEPGICSLSETAISYVITTSGSTGLPKAVAVTQANLFHAFRGWEISYELIGQDRHLQTAGFTFDVFVGDVVRALGSGGALVLCPADVRLDPPLLVELMETQGVTCGEMVPALMRPLVRYLKHTKRKLALRWLAIGSDRWTRTEALTLQEHFPGTRIINSYGVTEATIDSTFYDLPKAGTDQPGDVPMGRPFPGTTVLVLDGTGNPAPVGVPGELWIGGGGVAAGYLNQPELTVERFAQGLGSGVWGLSEATKESDSILSPRSSVLPWYRTGDMVRWNHDGQLIFVGRRDEQVKLRGIRVELGEIEAALLRHPQVAEAVVVLREDTPGDQRLVAYITTRTEVKGLRTEAETESTDLNAGSVLSPQSSALVPQSFSDWLPASILPNVVVEMERLPRLGNGKIDRRALPKPELAGLAQPEPEWPRTQVEKDIATIWQQALGGNAVSLQDNFFALGGHSLLAAQVAAEMSEQLRLQVPVRKLFEKPTLATLAGWITQQLSTMNPEHQVSEQFPLAPVSRTAMLPLSFAQQRLWMLEQVRKNAPEHSRIMGIPLVFSIQGQVRVNTLETALERLVARHESLRTTFPVQAGQPVQIIHPAGKVKLEVFNFSGQEETLQAKIRQFLTHPFDLEHGPLLRLGLFLIAPDRYIFAAVFHHIITDGWSMRVFTRELTETYRSLASGKEAHLEPLPVQFADFALNQRSWAEQGLFEPQLNFWLRQLTAFPEYSGFPSDRPRPALQSFRGAREPFHLTPSLTGKLHHLGQTQGVTLFMTLVTAFDILLYRWSGVPDVVVGTFVANRTSAKTRNLIGFFINSVALRVVLTEGMSFTAALAQVRETVLDAFANQEVPFEKVLETLQVRRSLERSPLFQTAIVLQNTPRRQTSLGDFEVSSLTTSYVNRKKTTPFDVSLWLRESSEGLEGAWEYNTDLFEPVTIKRLVADLIKVLEQAVLNPEQAVETMLTVELPPPHHNGPVVMEPTAFVSPRTPVEELVAEIWNKVLKIPAVGVFDNFFAIGGHSLLAAQVLAEIRETFGVTVTIRAFFGNPTVSGLAAIIAESQTELVACEDMEQVLAELENLSDEEARALLEGELSLSREEENN